MIENQRNSNMNVNSPIFTARSGKFVSFAAMSTHSNCTDSVNSNTHIRLHILLRAWTYVVMSSTAVLRNTAPSECPVAVSIHRVSSMCKLRWSPVTIIAAASWSVSRRWCHVSADDTAATASTSCRFPAVYNAADSVPTQTASDTII